VIRASARFLAAVDGLAVWSMGLTRPTFLGVISMGVKAAGAGEGSGMSGSEQQDVKSTDHTS
jgi:hypothetical protein